MRLKASIEHWNGLNVENLDMKSLKNKELKIKTESLEFYPVWNLRVSLE